MARLGRVQFRNDHRPGWSSYSQVGGQYRVLCSDGKVRIATATAEADSMFTIPARVSVKGQTVSGFVSQRPGYDLPYPDMPSPLYQFSERAYGRAFERRGRVLPEWKGSK